MATLDEILLKDEEERFAHLEFYQKNLDALKHILLREIPFPILNRIAVIYHGTKCGDAGWMSFLNALGIYDNVFIMWIEGTAKSYNELPIYWALRGPLQHKKTFGQVIDALIATERHDILTDVKPFVEGLLDNQSNSDLKSSWYSDFIQPTAPVCDDITEVNSGNSLDCELEKSELRKSEFNNSAYQQSTVQNIQDSNKTVKRKSVISVLLLHAVVDEDIARRLSSVLTREGIIVKTLFNSDELLLVNSPETIHALLSSVDFVIPIVSEPFLEDIHPSKFVSSQRNDLSCEEDNFANSTNNQYIYQLMLEEYMRNRCLNLRVRPVMVPNMKRHLLKYDILLTCSMKLWDSVPKFIEVLKKTKLMLRS